MQALGSSRGLWKSCQKIEFTLNDRVRTSSGLCSKES